MDRSGGYLAPEGFEGHRGRHLEDRRGLAWHHGAAAFSRLDGDKGCAFLWGDALPEDDDQAITAESVYRAVSAGGARGEGARSLARHSGLYVWIFMAKDGWVEAGCDPFGIFPVYYFHEKPAFGFASGLAALRGLPGYDASVDTVGMFRYMIENGCSGPRTLERSARRLEPGCSLRFDGRDGRLCLFQHSPLRPDVNPKLSFDEAVELTITATRKAVRRHVGLARKTHRKKLPETF